MKTERSQRCKETPKQMSKEESLELEHLLFDHQKGLSTHYHGGREATEKQGSY